MLRIATCITLLLGLAASAGCGSATVVEAAAPPRSHTFEVEIDGVPSPDPWTAVRGLGLFVAEAEVRAGDTGGLSFAPRSARPTLVTLEGAFDEGSFGAIRDWVKETYDGKDVRKSITIHIKDQQGDTVRTFNLIDTFPVSFGLTRVGSANAGVIHWTLEVRVNRIEMA